MTVLMAIVAVIATVLIVTGAGESDFLSTTQNLVTGPQLWSVYGK